MNLAGSNKNHVAAVRHIIISITIKAVSSVDDDLKYVVFVEVTGETVISKMAPGKINIKQVAVAPETDLGYGCRGIHAVKVLRPAR